MRHLARRHGRVRQEIARLKAMEKALADAADGQISLTGPDARAMATGARHSGMVGYDVQSAVHTETHLIVAHEVTDQGFDRDQLSPMAMTALGRDGLHVIADKGYFSGPEILACHEAGITATVPGPATSGSAAKGMHVKADFACDAGGDVHVCPAGDELIHRDTRKERSLQVRRCWINACQACPLRSRCPSGTERRIARWEHGHLIDAMRQRLSRDRDPMTLRRCTVEHSCGTIKAWMGATHFLTRRLKNVRTGMALNVLACSIKRMGTPVGIRRLMAAMPG